MKWTEYHQCCPCSSASAIHKLSTSTKQNSRYLRFLCVKTCESASEREGERGRLREKKSKTDLVASEWTVMDDGSDRS
jgi:hypothetical protein